MSELRECPWPHKADWQEYEPVSEFDPGDGYYVVCPVCGASGPCDARPELSEERWNTRPADAVREAAREVWESVPASHDPNDPMVQRHARALNALGAALAQDGRKS